MLVPPSLSPGSPVASPNPSSSQDQTPGSLECSGEMSVVEISIKCHFQPHYGRRYSSDGLLLIPLLDKITFSVRHLDVYITSLSNHPTNACAGSPISLTYYYLFIHFWFLLCWWKLISTVLTMLTCLVWGYHQNYPNWIIRDLDPADEQLCALQSGGWLHPFPTYINPACFCQVPGCYYACKNCAIIDQDS